MKTKFIHLSLIWALILLCSCQKTIVPKGEIESKQVELGDFSHLKLKGKFRAFYRNSDKNFLDVETYPNVYQNLKIETKGDSLIISEIKPTDKVDFYSVTIYTKNQIRSISISDSVEMNTNQVLRTDDLDLNLNKTAKFIGEIEVNNAAINMKDLSLMNVRGKAKKAQLHIIDTANFLSPYFMICVMDLKANNQTYTEVSVTDSLKGRVEDTSKLLYYNEPVRAFKIGENTKVNHQKLN